MAYVSNMDDEQQTNQSQGPVSPGGTSQTVHLAPSSGVGSTGGNPTPGAAAGAGGQFATLDKYLSANQGQADPLASKITGNINDQYNNLQGQNQQILQNVQGQVAQGYTPQDQGVLTQEAANPVSFASNPSNISSFQKQLNDQYTGPTSAESTPGISNQQAAINTAIATGTAQTGTDTGRQQLLAQNEATPTAGVTGLNSAILAQSPTAQGQIENAYTPFSNLVTQLNTGAAGIDTSIGQAQTQAQQASAAANKQIADQNAALQGTVNQNLATAGTQATQNQQQTISQEQAAQKAIMDAINSFEQGVQQTPQGTSVIPTSVWNNIGMGSFGAGPVANPNAPTVANVVTPDQIATAQALSTLGGGTNPFAGITPSTYNPFTSNPSISTIAAPVVSPLEQYMQQYFNAGNSGGAAPGSEFGAGSPTEANVGPAQEQFVQQQYQSLLNTLNTYLNSAAPIYNPQPSTGPFGPVRGTPATPKS